MSSPEHTTARREALVRRIAACLSGAAVDALPTAHVAAALAAYCATGLHPASEGPESIALLAARALSSVGEQEAARRVLAAEPPLEPLAGWLQPDRCSPLTLSLLGAGVLRVVRWPALGGGLVAVVDLRKVRRDASCLLELAYVQTMHRLVDGCAEVWAATAGEGVLALRGLAVHESVAGAGWPLRRELAESARARIAQQAERRGWSRRPRVIEVD